MQLLLYYKGGWVNEVMKGPKSLKDSKGQKGRRDRRRAIGKVMPIKRWGHEGPIPLFSLSKLT